LISYQQEKGRELLFGVLLTSLISPVWLFMDWRFFQQTLAHRLTMPPFHITNTWSKLCRL